jgi:hypothetical protein
VFEVTPLIAGLLPFNLGIDLAFVNYNYGPANESFQKVRIIRDLVFFLRETGLKRVESYRIDFLDSGRCYLEYKNGSCILFHSDKKILNNFTDLCNKFIYKGK